MMFHAVLRKIEGDGVAGCNVFAVACDNIAVWVLNIKRKIIAGDLTIVDVQRVTVRLGCATKLFSANIKNEMKRHTVTLILFYRSVPFTREAVRNCQGHGKTACQYCR